MPRAMNSFHVLYHIHNVCVVERKYFTCPSQELNPGRWIYRHTLYHVAVKVSFYRKAVEVYSYIPIPCYIWNFNVFLICKLFAYIRSWCSNANQSVDELCHVAWGQTINDIYDNCVWRDLSGRVLVSRLRGCGFEPHQRHCIVSLSKTH